MNLLLVMAGGAIGSGTRYLVGRAFLSLVGAGLWGPGPWATACVNVTGSTAMGLLAGTLARLGTGGEAWRLFLAVGVLGGYTTFSSFSLDAVVIAERGQLAAAATYVLGSVALGLAGLVAGLAIARSLAGGAA